MLKKILSMGLAVMILTIASGINVLAQSSNVTENQVAVKQETSDSASDLKSLVKAQNNSAGLNFYHKSTLAEYERNKQQGKKFSTTTKVLIGVGIAAAVIGVVVFAASRDKIRTF
jgi:hypothetical protein